jgi:hypothetical protein
VSIITRRCFIALAAALLTTLALASFSVRTASAAPAINIVSDIVSGDAAASAGYAPTIVIGEDEGIPVHANHRVYWLYFQTCYAPYRNTRGTWFRRCQYSVHAGRGQLTRLLGSLLVYYRWNGRGYDLVDARAVPVVLPL